MSEEPACELLIKRYRRGEPSAICELLEAHLSWIALRVREQLSRARLGTIDPDDIVGDVMVQLLKDRDHWKFQSVDDFQGLLIVIGQRVILQRLRFDLAQKRDRRRESPLTVLGQARRGKDSSLVAPVSEEDGPDRLAERNEQAERVRHARSLLPSRENDALEMKLEEELSFAQMGRQLGMSAEGARKLYRRAARHVRSLFRQLDDRRLLI
ncbi:MAG: sigma-70 family RNA polymerase sigma factor [Planctomycetota bacterium]